MPTAWWSQESHTFSVVGGFQKWEAEAARPQQTCKCIARQGCVLLDEEVLTISLQENLWTETLCGHLWKVVY